jgi:hypothetical protein
MIAYTKSRARSGGRAGHARRKYPRPESDELAEWQVAVDNSERC